MALEKYSFKVNNNRSKWCFGFVLFLLAIARFYTTTIDSMAIETATTTIIAENRTIIDYSTIPPQQQQTILLVHYHKTGSVLTAQYGLGLREASKTNCKKTTTNTTEILITNLALLLPEKRNKRSIFPKKRTHDPMTGCPAMQHGLPKYPVATCDAWHQPEQQEELLPNRVYVIKLTAPDFLCHLGTHQDVLLLESKNSNDVGNSIPNNPQTKIVHFVRDPLDMAVSNYLYHSQDPTPEPWVFDHYPCVFDHDFLNFVMKSPKQLISKKEVAMLRDLCDTLLPPLKFRNDAEKKQWEEEWKQKTKARREEYPLYHGSPIPTSRTVTDDYYQGLQSLTTSDALRLATLQLLVSKGGPGCDLLRMANNVVRFDEWQTEMLQNQQNKLQFRKNNNVIMTLTMNQDWTPEKYEGSLVRVTEFVLNDLRVLDDDTANNNTTVSKPQQKSLLLASAKEDLVSKVQSNAMKKRKQSFRNRQTQHITGYKLTHEQKQELMMELEKDPLLGPILTRIRKIIDTAHGDI